MNFCFLENVLLIKKQSQSQSQFKKMNMYFYFFYLLTSSIYLIIK